MLSAFFKPNDSHDRQFEGKLDRMSGRATNESLGIGFDLCGVKSKHTTSHHEQNHWH
jgi:hypothetical protein